MAGTPSYVLPLYFKTIHGTDPLNIIGGTYNFSSTNPLPVVTVPGVGSINGAQLTVDPTALNSTNQIPPMKSLLFSIEFYDNVLAGNEEVQDGDFYVAVPTTGYILRVPQPPLILEAEQAEQETSGSVVSGCVPILTTSTSSIIFTKGSNFVQNTFGLLTFQLVDRELPSWMTGGRALMMGTP